VRQLKIHHNGRRLGITKIYLDTSILGNEEYYGYSLFPAKAKEVLGRTRLVADAPLVLLPQARETGWSRGCIGNPAAAQSSEPYLSTVPPLLTGYHQPAVLALIW
jgi:hypothetical protein